MARPIRSLDEQDAEIFTEEDAAGQEDADESATESSDAAGN